MEHSTQELGSLHRPFGSDACQQLVDRIAISEAVERRVPVRMLIGGAKQGDLLSCGVSHCAAEIRRRRPDANRNA